MIKSEFIEKSLVEFSSDNYRKNIFSKLDLTIQVETGDIIITEETTRDLQDYKSASELTQARRSDELVAL